MYLNVVLFLLKELLLTGDIHLGSGEKVHGGKGGRVHQDIIEALETVLHLTHKSLLLVHYLGMKSVGRRSWKHEKSRE